MLDLYAPDKTTTAQTTMDADEVLGYLKNADTSKVGPLQALLHQTKAAGDPARPCSEHIALMEWLNTAYQYWEEHYPIEQPLATEFRKLLPLAAALAITEPNFLIPGAHDLHLLLDTMQSSAIGWQARLGRAGQKLERELEIAVTRARTWFDGDSVDLSAIYHDLVTATRKDKDRARRMAQRVIEVEQGKQKMAQAKVQAASMINALLEKYLAPDRIGNFLTGHWYESAQLVLLRFGEESKEWAGMSATTETLLNSLQAENPDCAENAGSRRQQLFEAITRLPREIKRWLLSLQHDEHAIDDAISIIEFTHMGILRQQDMDLQTIEPIPVIPIDTEEDAPDVMLQIGELQLGQWFLLNEENNGPLRLQLVLKRETDRQLLFTNQAGIKASQQSYQTFTGKLGEKVSVPLHKELSFSRALAHAARIYTPSDMKSLNHASGNIIILKQKESAHLEAEHDKKEQYLKQKQEREERRKRLVKQRGSDGLKITMGTWLGFHDGETPLLAKLAAHDREQDNYIFVNRNGIKMRALSRQKLASLMNKGLVEVLEPKSSFKDEISQARDNQKD